MRLRFLLLLLATGCAVAPTGEPLPGGPPSPDLPAPSEPVPPIEPAPPRENIAIAGLMQNARADAAAGRLAHAAASLERALRIEPRNPRLWHELARVRLRQGEYLQAESLAARSNFWAGKDSALRAENERLIAQARAAAGR